MRAEWIVIASASLASACGSDAIGSDPSDASFPPLPDSAFTPFPVSSPFDGATAGANCVLNLEGGNVTTFIDAIKLGMENGAAPASNAVSIADTSAPQSFAALVSSILSGDPSQACSLPASYRAASMIDPTAGPLWVVAEITAAGAPAPQLFWGTYVATQTPPKRPTWLVEAPHPYADENTEHQAADLFVSIGARALLVAGAHRCANTATSSCTGTTTACGSEGPYLVADAAHSTSVPFLAVHSAIFTADSATNFIQLHGNVQTCPMVLLSDGSGAWPSTGVLPTLAVALTNRGIAIGQCGDGYPTTACNLCGTDDVEGRGAAGSANACTTNGATYGAMIHIEQQATARTPGTTQYSQVLDAIGEALEPSD